VNLYAGLITEDDLNFKTQKGRFCMKNRLKPCGFMLVGMALLTFAGCTGAGSTGTPPSPPTPNEWTWINGANTVNQLGAYGTQGTASAGNVPGARVSAISWIDKSGNLWLFGGYGNDSTSVQGGDLNDLWKYSGGQWTWVNGSNLIEQPGTYGILGTAASSNVPGARYEAVSWADASGDFWLFGGLGIDSTGTRGDLNDLWEYSAGEWTWMGGSNVIDPSAATAGVYGTKGMAAPSNFPGARVDAASWTDAAGNLWLFGGFGSDSTGALGILNDLWKYSGGEWTWMSGSDLVDQWGTYGTRGTAASSNVPGARANPATWTDAAGNLWLFGGEGNDSIGCEDQPVGPCNLNDLWKNSAGEWTWMGGSNLSDQLGVYGTQRIAAPDNVPGARWGAVSWTDAEGSFWLFGGDGFGTTIDEVNDLWKYSGGEWTWVSGSNLASQTGTYGTQGTAASSNVPGCRDSAVSWIDASGNLWLFGGEDIFSIGNGGKFNDLWKYHP